MKVYSYQYNCIADDNLVMGEIETYFQVGLVHDGIFLSVDLYS